MSLDDYAHSQQVLYTSGPVMITRTFLERPETRKNMEIVTVFNEKTSLRLWHCFGSYAVHRITGSWIKNQPRLLDLPLRIMLRQKMKAVKEHSVEKFTNDLPVVSRIIT